MDDEYLVNAEVNAEIDYLRDKIAEVIEEISNVRKLRLIYDFVENYR